METTSFVKDEGRDLAHKSNHNKFLMNLAYLCGMLLKLSDVNVQWQGTNTHLPHLEDKITSFIRKLEMRLQPKRGAVHSFEKLKSFIEDNKLQNTVSPCMKADIAALQKDFQRYFLIQHPKEYDWMCDPGSRTPPVGFSTSEGEQFIGVASGTTMRGEVSVKDNGFISGFGGERLPTARYQSPDHAPDQSWSLLRVAIWKLQTRSEKIRCMKEAPHPSIRMDMGPPS